MINETTRVTISGVTSVKSHATLEKLVSNFMENLRMCQIKKGKMEVLPVPLMLDLLNRKL